MSGALPVYISPAFNERLGVWCPIPMHELRRHLMPPYRLDQKPKMLILTTCTYEGIIYPVNAVSRLCEENEVLFIADEAWAPYLRFHPFYTAPDSRGTIHRYNAIDGGAHFSVQSTHKALAAFSQASMIHLAKSFKTLLEETSTDEWEWLRDRFSFQGNGSYTKFRHRLLEVLRYWHSTSPHYPILASLDRAGVQMRLEGTRLLDERLGWVERFTEQTNALRGGPCVLQKEHILGPDAVGSFDDYLKDPLKLILGFQTQEAGTAFEKVLGSHEYNIQWEKSSTGCVEFLVTIGTYEDHIAQLLRAVMTHSNLLQCPSDEDLCEANFNRHKASGQVEVLPRVAAACDGELLRLDDSEDKVSAQMLVPYPPGIPVFLPGLKVTREMINLVTQVIRTSGHHDVHGVFEHGGEYYVKVMRDDELENAPDLSAGSGA